METSKGKNYRIRQERPEDVPSVKALIESAFKDVVESDHKEHLLVERLRHSEAFIPELSLVAESPKGEIVGHVLLTRVRIVSAAGEEFLSLGVAPLSVLPAWQRMGIGSALVLEAHRRAAALNYRSAVLLGHKDYYPRLGYQKASGWNITFPYDIPEDYCMAIELCPGGLEGVQGVVCYDKAFEEV